LGVLEKESRRGEKKSEEIAKKNKKRRGLNLRCGGAATPAGQPPHRIKEEEEC
jgi:hypothetical protein